jgi:hypothetical protein
MVPWMLRVAVVLPLVQAQLLVENRSTLEQLAKAPVLPRFSWHED